MRVPKDELEKIINSLNESNKIVAKSFLSWLLEKQMDSEDDHLTPDDINALEQARREFHAGETTSLEDMKRELGL